MVAKPHCGMTYGMEGEKRNPLSSLMLSVLVALVLLTPMAVYIALRAHEQSSSNVIVPQESTIEVSKKPSPAGHRIPVIEDEKPKKAVSRQPAPEPPVQSAPVAVKPALRPFPQPNDIPVGMEKTKLLATFGKPHISTTEVREGRPLETLRYLKPDSGQETVIYLSSGRVIQVSSAAY